MQQIKDSASYKNGQLAYIKEENTVKFYNYKGELYKEMDISKRLEKRYDRTHEVMDPHAAYLYHLGPGLVAYPDAFVTPKGTKMGNLMLAEDRVENVTKNTLGYPTLLRFNDLGLVIESPLEKVSYDDLGRVLAIEHYATDAKEFPYRTVFYEYKNDELVRAVYKGNEAEDHFTENYVFEENNIIKKVKKDDDARIIAVTIYQYIENVLDRKILYTLTDSETAPAVVLHVEDYVYDKKERVSEIQSFYVLPDTIESLEEVAKSTYVMPDSFIEYKENHQAKIFTYKNDKIIGRNHKDLSTDPATVTFSVSYVYNELGQLVKVWNDTNDEVSAMFSYDN